MAECAAPTYVAGERVFVTVASLYQPNQPWRVAEYTEVAATVEHCHVHQARGPEVLVCLDSDLLGQGRSGWAFPPDRVRPLKGRPRTWRPSSTIVLS